ncbi:hypothetical protein D3C85_1783280 [compost metagenome]
MKAWAHGLVQRTQAHPNAPRPQQTGKGADQPGHIGNKAFIPLKITEVGRQSTEIHRRFIVRQLHHQRFRQRLLQRKQQRREIGDMQR